MGLRCQEPGWIEIGKRCSAGRRSLWLRVMFENGAYLDDVYYGPYEEDSNAYLIRSLDWDDGDGSNVIAQFELCAGREGDDEYIIVARADADPLFDMLLAVLQSARYAATT